MKRIRSIFGIACLSLVAVLIAVGSAHAGDMDAAAAFEKIQGLEGTWTGEIATEGEHQGGEVNHVFRVSANGSVVQEVMNEGTEHEMINMYHLDGDDLLMTHYCAGGNQPRMKLAHASATELSFDYMDGTNLDVSKDPHIHAGKMVFKEDGSMDSVWTGWNTGEAAHTMVFTLHREGD